MDTLSTVRDTDFKNKYNMKQVTELNIKQIMTLSIRIIRVVPTTHHHGDVRYGTSRGIQCSCMSLVSVIWTMFRSPGLRDKLDISR